MSEERIAHELDQAGYRITGPRRAVIRALLEDDGYASPARVWEAARRHCPTVGLVTVYRTLELLSTLGFARRIHTGEGCHCYASADSGHRHHVVCRQCGAVVEVEGCDLSPFLARVSRETGYRIDDHLLELVGLCMACQQAQAPLPTAVPQQAIPVAAPERAG